MNKVGSNSTLSAKEIENKPDTVEEVFSFFIRVIPSEASPSNGPILKLNILGPGLIPAGTPHITWSPGVNLNKALSNSFGAWKTNIGALNTKKSVPNTKIQFLISKTNFGP